MEKQYKYETHTHSYPVSRCGRCDVRELLEFYKSLGYDGIFITNHFLDGNINIDRELSYKEKIDFYFSDYERAKTLEKEIGIKVFCGVEVSYKGTDFLVYGLSKEWFLDNEKIMSVKKTDQLLYFMENGALVIQAHPYRQASYIDHIRLFPHCVHGVEVKNACRTDLENKMADIYCEAYGLIRFAGSDNHVGRKQPLLAGLYSKKEITSEWDFAQAVKNGEMEIFCEKNPFTCD